MGNIVNSLAGLGRHKADKGVMSEGAAPSSYLVTLFMLYKNDQCSRIKFLSGSKICFSCPIRKLYFHQSEPEIISISSRINSQEYYLIRPYTVFTFSILGTS